VWKAYFEQITSVLMKRKIVTTVRTLFIIEDQQVLQKDRVKAVLSFYSSNKGMEAKIIQASEYRGILSQAGIQQISGEAKDIGIYGSRLLYVERKSEPGDIQGTFYRNRNFVESVARFFDDCSTRAQTIPADMTATKMSFTELLERDRP
jgi:hypothetical protein